VVGEDRKKPVIDADGFIDLFVDLLASRDVVGSEPATKSVRFEVAMEYGSDFLVRGGVADETRRKIKSRCKSTDMLKEFFLNPSTLEDPW
jgi:hypothetical protein